MPNRADPLKAPSLLADAETLITTMDIRVRVSIDQCFLLNMVEEEPAAVALRDVLLSAVRNGRVLCPIHPEESVFESSLIRPELRQLVFDLQRSLAEDFCFHSFGARVHREVVAFLLDRTLPVIWPRRFDPPDHEVEALSRFNRAGRNEYQQRLDVVIPTDTTRSLSLERILEDLATHHNQSFLSVLDTLGNNLPLPAAPATWEYAVAIGRRLRHLKVTISDLERLRDWVGSGRWHQSADLITFTRLWAAVELDGLRNGRRAKPNDMLDILRIAVAFADANVVFCDNAMASFVRQSRLNQVFPDRRVFGMRDIAEATTYIASL